jgi:hypothetical protein
LRHDNCWKISDLLSRLQLKQKFIRKSLELIKLCRVLKWYQHQRNAENTKHRRNSCCKTTKVRFAIEVTISNSCHCDSSQPKNVPKVLVVLEFIKRTIYDWMSRVVRSFKNSDAKGWNHCNKENERQQESKWPFFEQTLENKHWTISHSIKITKWRNINQQTFTSNCFE